MVAESPNLLMFATVLPTWTGEAWNGLVLFRLVPTEERLGQGAEGAGVIDLKHDRSVLVFQPLSREQRAALGQAEAAGGPVFPALHPVIWIFEEGRRLALHETSREMVAAGRRVARASNPRRFFPTLPADKGRSGVWPFTRSGNRDAVGSEAPDRRGRRALRLDDELLLIDRIVPGCLRAGLAECDWSGVRAYAASEAPDWQNVAARILDLGRC